MAAEIYQQWGYHTRCGDCLCSVPNFLSRWPAVRKPTTPITATPRTIADTAYTSPMSLSFRSGWNQLNCYYHQGSHGQNKPHYHGKDQGERVRAWCSESNDAGGKQTTANSQQEVFEPTQKSPVEHSFTPVSY